MTQRPGSAELVDQLRRRPRRDQRHRRAANGVVVAVLGLLVATNAAVFGGLVPGVQPATSLGIDVASIPLGVDQLIRRGEAPDADTRAGDGPGAGGTSAGGSAAEDLSPADGPAQVPDDAGAGEPAAPAPTEPVPGSEPAAEQPIDPPTPEQAPTAPETAPVSPEPSASPLADDPPPGGPPASQVLDLVNAEREDAGCSPLTVDDRLADSAGAHAADMVVREYFSHDSPDGSTPSSRAESAGYPGQVGENIATGYATAAEVVDGWLDSEGHRANILDCSYTVTGVGHDEGGLPGYGPGTWVQVFGTD